MLMGLYEHHLDDKGRVIIPSKYREILPDKLILTKGIDECLYLYQEKDFKYFIDKLTYLLFTKQDVRFFLRFFLSSATTIELDKQGRILIPSFLKTYAKLGDDIMILGVMDHLELWDKTLWEDSIKKQEGKILEISEHLFDEGESYGK